MRTDLAGKIRNTRLSPHKPLQPLFETVVNSFDAIFEAAPTRAWPSVPRVVITAVRDAHLGDLIYGDIDSFIVEDKASASPTRTCTHSLLPNHPTRPKKAARAMAVFPGSRHFIMPKLRATILITA